MILNADARAIPLADQSVHCVVTSPPYWGLRDYGTATWDGGDPACDHRKVQDALKAVVGSTLQGGQKTNGHQQEGFKDWCGRCGARRVDRQLGLERSPEEYVAALVAVFREVWRVLRDDGTCWLNLGDCYATGAGKVGEHPGGGEQGARWAGRGVHTADNSGKAGPRLAALGPMIQPNRMPLLGLKPKDLVGIPWRVAFALQADGWYLRSDVIWSKPNPMPESVTDRPTKSHEYLFLLAKRERYYYDAEAIKEPATHAGKIVTLGEKSLSRGQAAGAGITPSGNGLAQSVTVAVGRNRRTVWEIATQAYPEAHFATFPEALVEPCILAGTSERGACAACGAPRERVVEKERTFESGSGRAGNLPTGKNGAGLQGGGATLDVRRGPVVHATTTGWEPGCACAATTEKPIVLDPFAGSGTVGLVCQRLGRRFVGLELKPDYCAMAYKRTSQLGLV